jgi:hypothetical protein
MSKAINRLKNPCQNPHCGNTLFVADIDTRPNMKYNRVWRCTNCTWTQPRVVRYRPTNEQKAFRLWSKMMEEWNPTNQAIRDLVASGTPNGCMMVHMSTFNHHMDKLLVMKQPSNFDVAYHLSEAKKDLEAAKAFVESKKAAS